MPKSQEQILSICFDGDVWRVKRFTPAGSYTSQHSYPTEIAAAEVAFTRAAYGRMTLRLPDDTLDCLRAMFEMEGYTCFYGRSRWSEPWNAWMQSGYDAAQADASKVYAFGWPVRAEAVHAD